MDWRKLGRYLGYPDCCIESFILDLTDQSRIANRGKRKLTGTGYIPCAVCNKKTIKELKEAIVANRLHPEDFPNDARLGA